MSSKAASSKEDGCKAASSKKASSKTVPLQGKRQNAVPSKRKLSDVELVEERVGPAITVIPPAGKSVKTRSSSTRESASMKKRGQSETGPKKGQ